MTMTRTRWQILIALLFAVGLAVEVGAEIPPQDELEAVYRYRMKGKVRLLLFWVGKDDVGGGHIAVRRRRSQDHLIEEQIEVLFGSRPERVPGGVNRWGYGRETGRWQKEARGWRLAESVFEGFLKHSKEESLDEVKANEAGRAGAGEYLFDGVRSVVLPRNAHSEIRTFAAPGDFDYRNSDPVHCGYRRRETQPPNGKRTLRNQGLYEAPHGFLTGLNHLVRQVVEAGSEGERLKSLKPEPIGYVYHSRPYRLRLSGLRRLDRFDLPLDSEGRKRRFQNVARAEFVIRNLEKRSDHSFTLWFPLEGPFAGIPIRIVDKPRWWLRVELNLEPDSSGEVGARVASLPQPSCGETTETNVSSN